MKPIVEYLQSGHLHNEKPMDLSNFNKENPFVFTTNNGDLFTLKIYSKKTLQKLKRENLLDEIVLYIIDLCNACKDKLPYNRCELSLGSDEVTCVFNYGQILYYDYNHKITVYYDQASSDDTESMMYGSSFTNKFIKAFCQHR